MSGDITATRTAMVLEQEIVDGNARGDIDGMIDAVWESHGPNLWSTVAMARACALEATGDDVAAMRGFADALASIWDSTTGWASFPRRY